jgi:hypothetical protein
MIINIDLKTKLGKLLIDLKIRYKINIESLYNKLIFYFLFVLLLLDIHKYIDELLILKFILQNIVIDLVKRLLE